MSKYVVYTQSICKFNVKYLILDQIYEITVEAYVLPY